MSYKSKSGKWVNKCKVCKAEIGLSGWQSHVGMHKKAVEKIRGHKPTWEEVLDYYSPAPKKPVPGQPKLGDFE